VAALLADAAAAPAQDAGPGTGGDASPSGGRPR